MWNGRGIGEDPRLRPMTGKDSLMRTIGMRLLLAGAVALTVLLPAAHTSADDGAVTIGVGHSWTKSFGKTPFESKPKISVDKPAIASVSWRGEESGTLVITGNKEGDAVVTLKGKVRVTNLGTGGGTITVKDVTLTVPVKVVAADEYSKLVILYVGQKMSIKFPKGMKLGAKSPSNSNPAVVSVRRNSSKQLTLRGRKKGESWLRFKLLVGKKGKEKKVPGTIWVRVKEG